jgi:hypothetical protein
VTLGAAAGAQLVDSFLENGFCTIRGAFTADQAAAAADCVWRRMAEKAGIRRDQPATWPSHYDIEEYLSEPEVLACFTDEIVEGIGLLVGADRWCGVRHWGLWPVNFAFGADQPYDYPSWGWHIDGNWFRHTVDNPLQGLLVIGLFTDVEPRHGGTILAVGSHRRTARILARHPEGVPHRELFEEVLAEPIGNFHEITGQAGDVVLAHPFLFHTRGMKHGGPPRIISNTEASLGAPMNLRRENPDEYSPLELSILDALLSEDEDPVGARLCRF